MRHDAKNYGSCPRELPVRGLQATAEVFVLSSLACLFQLVQVCDQARDWKNGFSMQSLVS